MRQNFFITGSGTGVGKTLVTCSLVHQLRAQGRRVSALKPVISGYAQDGASDTAQILKSLGMAVNPVTVEAVSPWRFAPALAPSVAAEIEGREIGFTELVNFCTLPRTSEITLIEGAGGVMTPLSQAETMLEWAVALACPAVLVAGTYLGAVSHALSAGEALRARGVAVQAVVVSESASPSPLLGEGVMSAEETARMLKPFMPYAAYIVPLPRVAGEGDLWQHAADLTWMLR